jgi:hypothetical protein
VQDISIQAEDEKRCKIFDTKQKGRDQLGDLSTDERTKLKWILTLSGPAL